MNVSDSDRRPRYKRIYSWSYYARDAYLIILARALQDVVKVNPVSYANDAVRQLLIGASGMSSLWLDFAVLIGFAVVLPAIGIVLSWRLLSK